MKWTVPKFYNVRPVAVVDESQPQSEIDEEVGTLYMYVHTYYMIYVCMNIKFVTCKVHVHAQLMSYFEVDNEHSLSSCSVLT